MPSGYNIFWSGQYEYMLRAQAAAHDRRAAHAADHHPDHLSQHALARSKPPSCCSPCRSRWSARSGMLYLAGLQSERRRLGRHHRARRPGRGNRRGHAALPRSRLRRSGCKKAKCATLADLRDAIYHGAVKRVRPKAMTACVIIAGLVPILWSHGAGADVMKRIATPMVGGVVTSTIMELLVFPRFISSGARAGLRDSAPDHLNCRGSSSTTNKSRRSRLMTACVSVTVFVCISPKILRGRRLQFISKKEDNYEN